MSFDVVRTAAVHDEAMFWEPPIKVRQTAHTGGASSLHRVPWSSGFPFRRDRLANCIIILYVNVLRVRTLCVVAELVPPKKRAKLQKFFHICKKIGTFQAN